MFSSVPYIMICGGGSTTCYGTWGVPLQFYFATQLNILSVIHPRGNDPQTMDFMQPL